MKHERLTELSEEHGAEIVKSLSIKGVETFYGIVFSKKGLKDFVSSIERETREKCAKIVEDTDVIEARNSQYSQLGDASATRAACVAAIRNMED